MNDEEIGAITIGTDLKSSTNAVEIAEKNSNIWACIGMHPIQYSENSENYNFDSELFSKLIKSKKVVAVGECGLDYFKVSEEVEKNKQIKVFTDQIDFALKYDLPLMLHCRNSYREVLDILLSYKQKFGNKLRGNVHFFAGSIEEAKKFLEIDFTLSFTGVITFTNDYDEVIKYIPLNSILSETDAPFVAPIPHRGKRNDPSYVPLIVKKLAEIKGISEELMGDNIISTANRVFSLNI